MPLGSKMKETQSAMETFPKAGVFIDQKDSFQTIRARWQSGHKKLGSWEGRICERCTLVGRKFQTNFQRSSFSLSYRLSFQRDLQPFDPMYTGRINNGLNASFTMVISSEIKICNILLFGDEVINQPIKASSIFVQNTNNLLGQSNLSLQLHSLVKQYKATISGMLKLLSISGNMANSTP